AGTSLPAGAPAQEPPHERTPSFPTQASVITVDAVVVDASGQPVRGLTRDDFTVLEDGRPQTIVGFEARDVATVGPAPEDPTASRLRGTDVGTATRAGRVLVVLIDDVNLTPTTAAQVRPALEGWLRTAPRPEDEITLLTTSGEIWWTDAAGSGREDLLAVLERLRGKREARSRSELTMTDEEAAIIEYATPIDTSGDSRGEAPGPATGPPSGNGPPLVASSGSVLERVSRRFLDQGLCFLCIQSQCQDPMASCHSAAQASAPLVHLAMRTRLHVLPGTLERLCRQP